MGSVHKKTYTKPLPTNAEVSKTKKGEIARWRDRQGNLYTAPVVRKGDKVMVRCKTNTYYVTWRDADGLVHCENTECTDKEAAKQILSNHEREVQRIKAGVVTKKEVEQAKDLTEPLNKWFDLYAADQTARDVTEIHRRYTRSYLERLTRECKFTALGDLKREPFDVWLSDRTSEGMAAKTRNIYRGALVGFCNYLVQTGKLQSNPFLGCPTANHHTDRRRTRRALTGEELQKLLEVTVARPLEEVQTVRKGERKGERYAELRPETVERMRRLGRERGLMYKTLFLCGLRKSELASLTIGQVNLDSDPTYLTLNAKDEKNKEGNSLVLRKDLADDLRAWIASKPENERGADGLLFAVPSGLLRVLNLDLKAAGIPKKDERGRTLDLHAMRTTLGTWLNAAGVAPRTAQAALRHSDIKLTMTTYTDPKLLAVEEGLNRLPELRLSCPKCGGTCNPTCNPTCNDS